MQIRNYDMVQYTRHGLMPQPNKVRHCVLPCSSHCGWGSARGSGTGHEGADGGMGHQIHALPQDEHGELQNRFRRTVDPTYQRVPLLSTLDRLLDPEEAFNRFPGRDTIFVGNLNTELGCVQNPRN